MYDYIICPCGKEFIPSSGSQIYHNKKCYLKHLEARQYENYHKEKDLEGFPEYIFPCRHKIKLNFDPRKYPDRLRKLKCEECKIKNYGS